MGQTSTGITALVLMAAIMMHLDTATAQAHNLKGHVPTAIRQLPPIARVARGQRLDVAIGLPLRNQAALADLLYRIYDPKSPEYRHYLTPQQFTERFGPTATEYQAVMDFAVSRNLTITATHSNRMLLEVIGAVADIEQAFQVHLNWYSHPTEKRAFFAPDAEPSVAANLAILDISGLDDYIIPHPMALRPVPGRQCARPMLGSGVGGSYSGRDFRAAYAPGVTLMGTGQVVGLLEFDGYYSSDIAAYENQTGLPSVPLENVLLNRFKGTPGPHNDEVALDIEVAIAMAPGLAKVMVYEGTLPNSLLNQMAVDNAAQQLSSSWSYTINATTEQIFLQFAAQGQSMFQASGDDNAYSGAVDTPCDNPNLTIVGGTILTTSGPGANWVSETTWNWANTGSGSNGTGGGMSTVYPLPWWQQGLKSPSNQASTIMRNLPDVAMTADSIMVIYNNGSAGIFAGTSAATPLWAGFMALVNQQATDSGKGAVGFLNPTLYSVARGSSYATGFHDITTGNNTNAMSPTRFFAVPGYDLCTGLGTPAGQVLIDALSGTSTAPVVPVQIRMSAVGNQVLLSWTGGNPPYQVQMTSNPGSTNWAALGTTSNNSLLISATNSWEFYRILAH